MQRYQQRACISFWWARFLQPWPLRSSSTTHGSATSSAQSSPTGSTVPSLSPHRSNTAAIIGGAVGGSIAFLILLVAALFACHRHRKQREEETIRQRMEFAPVPYASDAGTSLTTAPASVAKRTPMTTSSTSAYKSSHMTHDSEPPFASDAALREDGERERVTQGQTSADIISPSAPGGPSTSSRSLSSPTNNSPENNAPGQDLTTLLAQLSHILARAPQNQGEAPPGYDQ